MKLYFTSIFITLISFLGISQVDIGVSKQEVSIYEKFNFAITIYSGCEIIPTQLAGFELVGEPSISQNSSTSTINGKTTKTTATTYTYVLKSTKSGIYKVGPIKVNCDGQVIESGIITMTVTEKPFKNSNFYTELYCNKTSLYPGEAFILIQKVFIKPSLKTSLERIIPSESSLIQKYNVTPMDEKGGFENTLEIIDGVEYNTAYIRQEVCFLTTTGNVVIEPYYTSGLIGSGFFDTKRLEAYSNIIRIKSKKKPNTNLLNDFGLTGDFTLTYQLDESTLKVGEAIDYTISLTGTGNIQVFNVPELDSPESFETFEPELIEKLEINENGFIGNKSYHFTFVPTQPGDFTIPAYTLAYFDLKTKSYKELSTKDILIHIEEGDSTYGAIEHKTENQNIENELRGPHSSPTSTFSESDLLAGSFIHYVALLLPFGLLILVLTFKKRKNTRTDEHKVIIKKKKAKKGVKQYLNECKKLHKDGNDGKAVKALSLALKSYLKDKMNLTEHDLTLKNIHTHITEETTRTKITACWNTIEMYQYSPVSANAVDDLIYQTEEIINEIDKQL